MKRRFALLGASLLVLAGCRALVGLEVYEVEGDGGAGASDGSVADALTQDAGSDSGSPHDSGGGQDTNPPPPPDGGPSLDDGSCATQNPCPPCCHMKYGQAIYTQAAQDAKQSGCICAGGGTNDCTTQCATECAANFTGGQPTSNCNQCLDQLLTGPQCQNAMQTICGVACKPALDCLARTCGI